MTIKDVFKIIDIVKVNSEFIIKLNNKPSTLYDLKELPEDTKLEYIQIDVIQNNLTKDDINIYTIYESNVDLEIPLHCKYDLIVFNFCFKRKGVD